MTKSGTTRRATLGGLAGAAITSYAAGAGLARGHTIATTEGRTVANRLNIQSATMRPAMRGIFSGGHDQRAALLDFIREAADGGKTIEWGPLDVSLDVVTKTDGRRGLAVPSRSHWVMHPETRIRALNAGSFGHYEILNMIDVQDIAIEGCGAKIIGDRYIHTGSTGEWGHGVNIRGCSRITIRDLATEDCWGDGFYIGATTQVYSDEILLEHIHADNNRRQGLSLISARGFRCVDSTFLNTIGAAPEAGIDVEPNDPGEYLEDVEFSRIVTGGNNNAGFKVYLNAMDGTSNRVSMTVDGLRDDGSRIGIGLGFPGTSGIPGLIRFSRPYLRNAGEAGISARNYQASGPNVIVEDPVIEDWNRHGNGRTSPKYGSGVAIYAESDDGGTAALGNIHIINPRYILNSGAAPKALAVQDSRSGADTATGLSHLDPLEMPAGLSYWLASVGEIELRDREGRSVYTLPDNSLTISSTTMYSKYLFPANTSSRIYTLNNLQPIGTEMEFVVSAIGSGRSRLTFGSGVSLLPENSSGGFYIYSDQKGARLRIRKTGANEWSIIERSGTWTLA